MPNMRGGKAYKKGKKIGGIDDDTIGHFLKRDENQDYARIIRKLGNRRVICFCNDGKDRICKIRGSLCKGTKKQWIDVGDIVLISFREFGESGSDTDVDDTHVQVLASGRKEIADIIGKFQRDHWKFIKQDGKIHRNLFFTGTEGCTEEEDIFDYGDVKADRDITGKKEGQGQQQGQGQGQQQGQGQGQQTDVEWLTEADIDRI